MTLLMPRWLRSEHPETEAGSIAVTVYSREGCDCCDKALAVLNRHKGDAILDIQVVDIDRDPELVELHGLSVPVVEIEGKVRFRGLVNPVLLERLLLGLKSQA